MNNENCIIHRFKTMRLLSESKVPETGAFSKGINKGLNIALSTLGNKEIVPSVDAVEVVRCGNCKHFREPFCCRRDDETHRERINMLTVDFCSYGERKDNG